MKKILADNYKFIVILLGEDTYLLIPKRQNLDLVVRIRGATDTAQVAGQNVVARHQGSAPIWTQHIRIPRHLDNRTLTPECVIYHVSISNWKVAELPFRCCIYTRANPYLTHR